MEKVYYPEKKQFGFDIETIARNFRSKDLLLRYITALIHYGAKINGTEIRTPREFRFNTELGTLLKWGSKNYETLTMSLTVIKLTTLSDER